jgi:putative ABC transport system ATP-binding protein
MLRLEAVSKTFRTGADTVEAIVGVDLSLDRGDLLTVIGSNGAGKTTLLNLIAGAFPPTSGRILLHGEDLTNVPAYRRARRIGRIVQNPLAGTAPSMTVAENLALAAKRGGRTLRLALPRRLRRELRARLASLEIGLDDRLDCRVSLLSGGERQALTIMMATLARPEVLLLDEHTAALDPRNAALITRLTCGFIDELGLTTVMVTHNMEQAIAVGNRLVMMHKGRIIHELDDGPKRESTVPELVELFSRLHVSDDELLLEAAY